MPTFYSVLGFLVKSWPCKSFLIASECVLSSKQLSIMKSLKELAAAEILQPHINALSVFGAAAVFFALKPNKMHLFCRKKKELQS